MAEESGQTPQSPQPGQPQLVQAPVPVIYYNASLAQATEFELALDLGYRIGQNIDISVRTVTTWEHAKRLRDLLDAMLERYEENVGKVRDIGHLELRPMGNEDGETT